MRILPYISEEYTTAMTPTELLDRLSQFVEPRQYWARSLFRKSRSKAFEGELDIQGFKLRPIIGYRNSFIPQISGKVIAVEGGSKIQVEMSLHPFVKSLMTSWLGSIGLGAVAITVNMILTLSFNPLIFFTSFMWCFGYYLTKFGFNKEAHSAQQTLNDVFNWPNT